MFGLFLFNKLPQTITKFNSVSFRLWIHENLPKELGLTSYQEQAQDCKQYKVMKEGHKDQVI